ncbi:hypothetical protein BH18CHL1_BH18CHL1_04970 [soil metagenome]
MRDQNPSSTDQQAIERYRYMLRTAPPETLEQAHAEAFERLTPEQRQQVLQGLSGVTPENERTGSDDPASLARMATRAEMRQPGTLERTFGGMGGGMSGGIGMGGWFLTTLAASFVGTAIAQSFFGSHGLDGSDAAGQDAGSAEAADAGGADAGQGADVGGQSGDYGQGVDTGTGDAGGGDLGGDFGGGDFGGFGGGDFGGGDFGGI